MNDNTRNAELIELSADIVSAYVSNNTVASTELPGLIHEVQRAIMAAASSAAEPPKEELKPAVPVRRSVTPDHLVCLEDGKTFRSLKRHLRTDHNLTPAEYRERWGLKPDYPMVAPNYAKARSELAKKMGLGQKRKAAAAGGRRKRG